MYYSFRDITIVIVFYMGWVTDCWSWKEDTKNVVFSSYFSSIEYFLPKLTDKFSFDRKLQHFHLRKLNDHNLTCIDSYIGACVNVCKINSQEAKLFLSFVIRDRITGMHELFLQYNEMRE